MDHIRQHPQYAVLLACIIGLIVYSANDLILWFSLNLALVIGLVELLAVMAIPFALFRFLWLAGNRMGQR